MYLSIKYPDIS